MTDPACRLCGAALDVVFVDLGSSPPCESYLTAEQLSEPELYYPLDVRVCQECLLVQLPAHIAPEDIFSDYAYFSSYSTSWVEHARRFADAYSDRLGLDSSTLVVEVASNDGYLLRHFVDRSVPVLGVEPAGNIASVAEQSGIPTENVFFSEQVGMDIAKRHGLARLVVANNVVPHVPDPVDFAKGLRALVADDGLVSIEFQHLLRQMEKRQYDCIYHEHYSYLTLRTAELILGRAGLRVVDVEELDTHGGSLRVLSAPEETAGGPSSAVARVSALEEQAGLHTLAGHLGFSAAVAEVKQDFLGFLLECKRQGATVAGYGAPGKGNTLLNHCGVRADLLPFTVDRSPHKQGKFLPGSRIPIHPPSYLEDHCPDYIVVLPWNLQAEIAQQLAPLRERGARLVVPIPQLTVI
jgi:hypothetical protein